MCKGTNIVTYYLSTRYHLVVSRWDLKVDTNFLDFALYSCLSPPSAYSMAR